MKFVYENVEYRIGFSHVTEINNIPGVGSMSQRSTIARIRTGERDKDEVLVVEGKVTQYYKDAFRYDEARKQALKKALSTLAMHFSDAKEFRTATWTAYHSRLGGLFTKKLCIVCNPSNVPNEPNLSAITANLCSKHYDQVVRFNKEAEEKAERVNANAS